MTNVLVIEDEPSIADTLVFALEGEGFGVVWRRLGREGIEAATSESFDFVVLDVGLPDMSGFEVCKAIRKSSEVPILFLTARGEEIDRIVGLEIGGDDYVVKPFSPREVATRVRTILKRVSPRTAADEGSAAATARGTETGSDLTVDSERRAIAYHGVFLSLTAQEYRLLEHLARHPDRVWSRLQLLEAIGAEADPVYERNIDTHVKALRAKLRSIDGSRDPIRTHRGFGYSFASRDD